MKDGGQTAQAFHAEEPRCRNGHRVRFGTFEVDLRSGELRKHGIKIKLQEKPFQVLALLIEQPGEVVSREELQRRLWPADTFVDFDRNLNTATNRLRQALGDSAENPRFIETIPRRGYRLIVPIEHLNGSARQGELTPGGNGSGLLASTAPGTGPTSGDAGLPLAPLITQTSGDRESLARNGEALRPAAADSQQEVPQLRDRPRWISVKQLFRRSLFLLGVAAVLLLGASRWFGPDASGRNGVLASLEPSRKEAETTLASASARAGRTMLVVLPFENLSGDPQQDYVSDGLTDEMIAQVGRLSRSFGTEASGQRIGVVARTSSMHYKGGGCGNNQSNCTRKSVAEIGKELGVDYALEGSTRRSGGRLRITAQLVAVRDQTPVWSATYERDESDLLSVQQDVAADIASALAVELGAGVRGAGFGTKGEKASPPAPASPEAYLLGRFSWNKRTSEGLYKGLEHFRRAVRTDSNYAAAYAGIADSYVALGNSHVLQPHEAFPKAKAAAERALQIDPNLAEAHASLARVIFQYEWDWQRAEQEYQRAIELNPAYATAHQWYADYLSAMGRHEEALREIATARRLDPLSLIIHTAEGILLYQARRYDEALATCQRALELSRSFGTDFFLARVCVANVYVKKKMYKEGVEQRYKAMIAEGIAREDQERFWRAYATGGIQGARRWLIEYRAKRMQEQGSGAGGRGPEENKAKQYIPGYYMAVLYGALGEKDKAFEWLERSYQQRDSFLARLKVDPNLDDLRADPRFQSLLERMKLD